MDIKALSLQAEEYILDRRRYYQSCPELTGQETETRSALHKDLEALGITDIVDTENCFGVYATIHGGKPGKTVALRADIDGLPVKEETGLPYASKNEGKMHACGHDTHIAMLLGAAKILNEHREELCGNVRIIFQPAEENCSGAYKMIAAGAIDGVDAIYGAHIWGDFDAPYISLDSGPRMALADLFEIEVEGVSAHGSAPHLGIDAITCAVQIYSNLQQYVSRMNDPLAPLVMTIGTINGGTRFNVIPNKVVMSGSVRAYANREKHFEYLTRIIENTGASLGCSARLVWHPTIGPVINDCEELNVLARNAAEALFGPGCLREMKENLGSEDFAAYREKIPGVFAFIGSRNPEKGITYTNHHEKFTVDESVLKNGTALMAQFAVDFLSK